MSATGRPDTAPAVAAGLSVGIVATRWNAEIVERLVRSAGEAAREFHTREPTLVRVAGAVEIPVVAQQLARTHDAVVALGCVVRGATPHFDYVCQSVTQGLTSVALGCDVPVGNGVLTCETMEQARQRSGGPGAVEDKGRDTMAAALDAAQVLAGLRGGEALTAGR